MKGSLVFQIVDLKEFEQSNAKKGIKAKLTLSDGTSYCQTHLMEKAWNYVQDIEKLLKMFNIVRVDAKGVSIKEVNTKFIMILQNKIEIFEFPDSRKLIGSPKDYQKNLRDGVFNTHVNLFIGPMPTKE